MVNGTKRSGHSGSIAGSVFLLIVSVILLGALGAGKAFAISPIASESHIESIDCSPIVIPAGSTAGRSVTEVDIASRIYPKDAVYQIKINEEGRSFSLTSSPYKLSLSFTEKDLNKYSFKLYGSHYYKNLDNKLIITDKLSGKSFRIPVILKAPKIVGPDSISLYEYETKDLSTIYHFEPATYVGENGQVISYPLSVEVGKGGWYVAQVARNSTLVEAGEGHKGNRDCKLRLFCDNNNMYTTEQDTERYVTLTLKSPNATLKWTGQKKIVMRSGQTLDVHKYLKAVISPKFKEHQTAAYNCTSSNSGIVDVSCSSDSLDVYALHEGFSTITVKAVCGNSVSFGIQVKPALAKTSLPKVQERAFDNKILIEEIESYIYTDGFTGDVSQIQVWRSTKKNGKYKLIKTLGPKQLGCYPAFEDKRLKANTAYYYKVRARCSGEKTWGAFSKPVKYWTAPKRKVAGKKVNGQKVTWRRAKGVKGYIVTDTYVKKLGYNVFGQKVMWGSSVTRTTSKTKWKLRKASGWVDSITPYAKHGKYYYAHGKPVVKKTAKFKERHERRYVSG